MPHIHLKNELPGIRGLVSYRPETGRHLYALARILLGEGGKISGAERELIATYVSSLNGCKFCTQSHASAARYAFGEKSALVDEVILKGTSEQLSPMMNVLLKIASKVQQSGKEVTVELVQKAKELGATDLEIHDTVLIAAAFCMFNRYVDGLAAITPDELEAYAPMGERMITLNYQFPNNKTDGTH